MAACGKHFPGHGDTSVDSHLELPLVEHPPDRIRRVECVPFREAIAAGVAFIMTAHVLVPSLDEEQPATLSPRIVQGMLRDELGFQGVILSDDLEMKAIAKTYAGARRGGAGDCRRLRRRCSICSGDVEVQAATLEALVHAVEDGRDSVQAPRRCAEAAAAREGAVPGRAGRRQTSGAQPAARARLRRAPAHRRRDGRASL